MFISNEGYDDIEFHSHGYISSKARSSRHGESSKNRGCDNLSFMSCIFVLHFCMGLRPEDLLIHGHPQIKRQDRVTDLLQQKILKSITKVLNIKSRNIKPWSSTLEDIPKRSLENYNGKFHKRILSFSRAYTCSKNRKNMCQHTKLYQV